MLEAFGLTAEEALYFGDDLDDLEPISRCGLGVAVANALEPVAQAAKARCLSNDQDGVAQFLEEHFL